MATIPTMTMGRVGERVAGYAGGSGDLCPRGCTDGNGLPEAWCAAPNCVSG